MDALRFQTNKVICQSRVSLRGGDRGVPKNELERRERAAILQPPTSKRMTEHVRVESGNVALAEFRKPVLASERH